jgi:acetylornithine/N-succinyldiaminopimelate aminotransferase
VKNSCLDKVFLCNSGAEANEGAIKLARKYGRDNRNGAVEIITAVDSFHGRTTGALAATGNANYQANFLPLMTGFVHVPFGDIDAIKAATNEGTCAVMLEPVQGEGGVISPPEGYLKAVREWCTQQGILLILDEIQTGVGRLGTMWGYEQFGIEPDVMTIAKAMGGGVPIGAFLCKDACDVLRPGDHGSTYGGNALTCAASYAVLNHVKEEGLVEYGRIMGERLKGKLEEVKARHETAIKEVRGMGLLLAVEFHEPISGELVTSCNAAGLLLNPVRPTAVRFMPPLNISESEVDIAVDRFERSLEDALERIAKAK